MERKFARSQTFDQDGFQVEELFVVPLDTEQLASENEFYDDDADEWSVQVYYMKL
jgi:hypothetical protein